MSSHDAAGAAADAASPTFEQIVARLETIAGRLESDDIQLEAALALFEEGVGLSRRGTQQLDAAERRLEVLLDNERSGPLVVEGK